MYEVPTDREAVIRSFLRLPRDQWPQQEPHACVAELLDSLEHARRRAEKAEGELKEAQADLRRAVDTLGGGFCAAYQEHIRNISFREYLREREGKCEHCIETELLRYQGLRATNEVAFDIAVRLFLSETITQGEGAIIARLSRCEFINQLLARGISPIQEDE